MTSTTKAVQSKNCRKLFKNYTFVVSGTENEQISRIIIKHGGKIQKSLTTRTDYFIQGYNNDDDDRLGEAGDKDVRVVAPEYLNACVASGKLLNINEQALGSFDDSDGFPKFMFTPQVKACFKPPNYECREREELPQSFGEFLKTDRCMPTTLQKTIYLLPLQKTRKTGKKRCANRELKRDQSCSDPELKGELISKIANFLRTFFCLPVKILPELALKIEANQTVLEAGKYNYSIKLHRSTKGVTRLDAMETIATLEDLRPADGVCILGVTDMDICEDPADDGPLLGRATGDQAGILSTWHHQSAVCSVNQDGNVDSSQSKAAISATVALRAIFNTAAHETMHMFGLDHCPYYACIMNSWSNPTVDPRTHPHVVSPLHLCPIDLRKLHQSVGFDTEQRYQNLRDFYAAQGITEEVDWITNILKIISAETVGLV